MKRIGRALSVPLLLVAMTSEVTAPAYAATSPSLGAATTYGVLANTYINPVPGTTINGDVGFTTAPAIVPAGVRTNYGSGAAYTAAGAAQSSALAALAAQPCTHTFPAGAVNLSTDISHGQVGVYAPGVYCTNNFVTIGVSGITLSGVGVYLFRTGNITTANDSVVRLTNGASACDIWWTPSGPIEDTLGQKSVFAGTYIQPFSDTLNLGNYVSWSGRALAFSGVVRTSIGDTITVPTCSTQSPDLLRVIKTVVNDNGGTAVASDFNLHVTLSGVDVAGSPAVGVASPGRDYWLIGNTYVVSEDAHPGYTATFSGDCDSSGKVVVGLAPKTCTITNTNISPTPTPTPTTTTITTCTPGPLGPTCVTTTITSTPTPCTAGSTGAGTGGAGTSTCIATTPSPTPTCTPSGGGPATCITTPTPTSTPTCTPSGGGPATCITTITTLTPTCTPSGGGPATCITTITTPTPTCTPSGGGPATCITTITTSTPTCTPSGGGPSSCLTTTPTSITTCTPSGGGPSSCLTTTPTSTTTCTSDGGGTATCITTTPTSTTTCTPNGGGGTATCITTTPTSITTCRSNGGGPSSCLTTTTTFITGSRPTTTPTGTSVSNVFIPIFPNSGFNTSVRSAAKETQLGLPMRLIIPRIKVNAVVEGIGLTPKKAVDVPKRRGGVGWYKLGPKPGEPGSAVIVGHFARKTSGWAVFNDLYKLRQGDAINIKDNNGKVMRCVVRSIRVYDRKARPFEVYTSDSGSHLNLITCTGVWNNSIPGFTKRLVVFADIAN